MSETVIFTPKKQTNKIVAPDRQKGISANYHLFDDKKLLSDEGDVASKHTHIGLSYYRTFFFGDTLNNLGSFSISVGWSNGIDGTMKIYDPLYLTGSASYPSQFSLALPVKIVHTEKAGLFMAPILKKQRYYYDKYRRNVFVDIGPDSFRDYNSWGAKISFYTFFPPDFPMELYPPGTRQSFFSVTAESGKLIGTDSFYFSVGIKYGGY